MTWNLRSSCLQLPSPVLTSMQHSSRFYTELRMEHKAWRRLGKSSTRRATSPASIVLELGKMYHSILELKKKVFKFVWLLTFPQMPKIWEFKALLMFEERRKASFKVSMNLSVKKKKKNKKPAPGENMVSIDLPPTYCCRHLSLLWRASKKIEFPEYHTSDLSRALFLTQHTRSIHLAADGVSPFLKALNSFSSTDM